MTKIMMKMKKRKNKSNSKTLKLVMTMFKWMNYLIIDLYIIKIHKMSKN